MTSLMSTKTLAALNPFYWDMFSRAENKALLNQVEELKAELHRAQQEIVSLETKNMEICENSEVQKSKIQQLTELSINQEAKIQQLSLNNGNQEAKIQQLSGNNGNQNATIQLLTETTASQDARIRQLAGYLTAEEDENKTLWGQIKYLTTELGQSKKSVNDWKDLYHRERDLHAENKKQKTDLEKQLSAITNQLQGELAIRGLMVNQEKQLKTEFNELQATYQELRQTHETLLREHQEQRERDLHAENKKQKMDLEKQLSAITNRLQGELTIRGLMVNEEKQLRTEFNELQAAYEELRQTHETLLRQHQEQQPEREMLLLQHSVTEQTELIKSLLAEQHHMSNTIRLMTEAASVKERSIQQEMEELKQQLNLQSSLYAEHDNLHRKIIDLEEQVDFLEEELERTLDWADEQSDLLQKERARYKKEKRQRDRLYKQLQKAKKQLEAEQKNEELLLDAQQQH